MKDKPITARWQALFQAVSARGKIGVIVLALLVVLACVLTGTPAPVIYSIAVLMLAVSVLVVVVGFTTRHDGTTPKSARADPAKPD
jgi:hypothetical protein